MSISASYPFARGVAAASAFWLGHGDIAQAHFHELLRIAPGFAPHVFRRRFGPDVEPVGRLVTALEALRTGRNTPLAGQVG